MDEMKESSMFTYKQNIIAVETVSLTSALEKKGKKVYCNMYCMYRCDEDKVIFTTENWASLCECEDK